MAEYIKREAIVDLIQQYANGDVKVEEAFLLTDLLGDITNIPAENVQPVKRAYWILKSEKIVDVEVKLPTECSNCDFSEFNAEKYNYCPDCGADMRSE